jgi:hypothetical protein
MKLKPGEWMGKKLPEYCGRHGHRILGFILGNGAWCKKCLEEQGK